MKIFGKIFLFATALVFASCAMEELDGGPSGLPEKTVSLYADVVDGSASQADTKVTFEEDGTGNVVRLGWKESGESFTGFVGTSNSRIQFTQKAAPSEGTAEFEGKLAGEPAATETLYAVYPAVTSGTAAAVPFDLSSQEGLAYDESLTYMYASCKVGDLNNPASPMTFKHLCSTFKIDLNFPDEFEGQTISTVTIKCPTMVTAGTLDITGATPVVKSVTSTGTITLSRSGNYPMDKWENVYAYIHFLPTDVTNFSVEARIGDDLYVANIPARADGKPVEAGKRYHYNLKNWTYVQEDDKVYHVTPDGTAGSGHGYNWDDPTTLSSALERINSSTYTGTFTIYLANGTYHPDKDLDYTTSVTSSDATKGWEIQKNINMVGGFPAEDGSKATILDGKGSSYHVLVIDAVKADGRKVIVKNLTVTGGRSGDGKVELSRVMYTDCNDEATLTATNAQGAGIAMLSSAVEMDNVIVKGNSSTEGAILSLGTDLKMTNCKISDNTGTAVGGLKVLANANWQIETLLDNCTVSGNVSSNWGQGGMLIYGDKGKVDFIARNCTVSNNQGREGSGMQIQYANVTLDSCTISGNYTNAGQNGKGAIYAYQGGTTVTNIKILNSVISGNRNNSFTNADGTALYLRMVSGAVTLNCDIINSAIINNQGARKGSYFSNESTSSPMNLKFINTTIYGNTARQGASLNFYNPGSTINADLISCTITGNTYGANASMYFEHNGLNFNAYNCVISGNEKADGTACLDISKSNTNAGGVTPVYKSSIIGSQYYNASGTASSVSPAFAYASMIDNVVTKVGNTYVVKLKGSSAGANPAIGNGSTLSALQGAVSGSEAKTYVSNDQTGAGRSDSYKVMGAYVGNLSAGGSVTVNGTQLKVMSFNILTSAKDGSNWSGRREAARQLINYYKPAVIGVQEATATQLGNIKNDTGYTYYAIDRGDGEMTPIMYDASVVTMDRKGYFWLSATPGVESDSWNDPHRRITTWALFNVKATGEKFFMVNTHLGLTWQSASNGVQLIVNKIKELNPEGYPTFMTGDYNVLDHSTALTPLKFIMENVRETAPVTDHLNTFNNKGGSEAKIIDHIYYNGFIPVKYETITRKFNNVTYVSDHYPIMATFQF